MYCLVNICYVCLEKKSKLIRNINSSLSGYKDIIHIIGYLPFNLAWLKTLRIILICEECCLRLRETYQFLEKCLKNSALLRGYRDNLNTTPISNTENQAELLVKLINTHKDIHEVKCEIQSEDEEINTFQWQPNMKETGDMFVDFEDSLVKEGIICKKEVDDKPDNNSTEIIEDTEDVFVNLEDYFVKEENIWKREEVYDTEEYPRDNNSTENMDNESGLEISVYSNVHITNTHGVTSGFACKQVHTSSEKDLHATATKPHNWSTCSKSSITKSEVKRYTRIHTGEKPYKCTVCRRDFTRQSSLVSHIMRTHTGENPNKCARCEKCFSRRSHLLQHITVHTGEKPYQCTVCKKCFGFQSNLIRHMGIHTGKKPYKCATCEKCFRRRSHLVGHMRTHTGEKPYMCSVCDRYFKLKSYLNSHLRVHTK